MGNTRLKLELDGSTALQCTGLCHASLKVKSPKVLAWSNVYQTFKKKSVFFVLLWFGWKINCESQILFLFGKKLTMQPFENHTSQGSNSRDLTFSSKVGETREFLQAQQHVPSATANFPIKVLAGTILWHYLPRKHLPRSPRLLLADVGLLGSTGALWFIMKIYGYDNIWYLL